MNLPIVKVTREDLREFPTLLHGEIKGRKVITGLKDDDLQSLTSDPYRFNHVRQHINPETNSTWMLHRVADELLRRSLINSRQHGQMLNQ